MGFLFYVLFSVMLFFWTTGSIKYESPIPQNDYLIEIVLLGLFLLVMSMLFRKNQNKKQQMNGVLISAVLMNIGMSINYQCINRAEFGTTNWKDIALMLLTFIVVYLVITAKKHNNGWISKISNRLIVFAIPSLILFTRLRGELSDYGAYLSLGGILIFGIVLAGFPFVAASFMSANETSYRNKKVGNISGNLTWFLIYTLIVCGCCALCNENNSLLVFGLTATILFLIRCKDIVAMIIYTALCLGGVGICLQRTHIADRIQIWLNPIAENVLNNSNLQGKAETVLYLFRHINNMGWWGKGIGTFPEEIYKTLNTDHSLVLLINDYSILFCMMVIILGALFVRWMLIYPKGLCEYDRYLNFACALIVCFIILLNVASALGSFITAGLGFPWVSSGNSFNFMFTIFVAIHCGLLNREEITGA